ncbi:MAG TPA: hypothetical protein VK447_22065 [Myxococcaceae bacterium]|nr:hypothetical protein [Myxococcaceae bacterium]
MDQAFRVLGALFGAGSAAASPGSAPDVNRLAPGAQPLRAERMLALLELNGITLAPAMAALMSMLDDLTRARLVLTHLAMGPGAPSPAGIEQELLGRVGPSATWDKLHQDVVQQRDAFQRLVDGLASGGLPPAEEQFLLRSLDQPHQEAYQSAKAPQPGSTAAALLREMETAKHDAQRRHACFLRALNVLSRGGPSHALEQSRFNQEWQDMARDHRLWAFTAKVVPGASVAIAAQVTRQLDTFTRMLSLLQRVGASGGLLQRMESVNARVLSTLQRAGYQRLKAWAASPPEPHPGSGSTPELGAAFVQNQAAVDQVAMMASLAVVLEQTQRDISLVRARAVTR